MIIFLPNGVRILMEHLSIYKPIGERGIMFTVGENVETYTFRTLTNRTEALIRLDENLSGLFDIYIEDSE